MDRLVVVMSVWENRSGNAMQHLLRRSMAIKSQFCTDDLINRNSFIKILLIVFAGFALNIAVSRFRSRKEISQTMALLAEEKLILLSVSSAIPR